MNEGKSSAVFFKIQNYIASCKENNGQQIDPIQQEHRVIGIDFHRNLIKGGIYLILVNQSKWKLP